MTRFPGRLVLAGLVLLALAAGAMWATPSDTYLFLPDRAKPLAGRVTVQGEKPDGKGGIYYVDVIVRKASLLEQLLAPLRPGGSTAVPAAALLPPGTSERERNAQNRRQMRQSQRIAAAVALRALGYRVEARPVGAEVVGVDPRLPAGGKLQPTDVVVGVDGKVVRTVADLRRLIAGRRVGAGVRLRVRRGERTLGVTLRTVADPRDRTRPIVGIAVSQAADIRLPVKVDIDLGAVGGPSAGLAFALDVMEELGRDVDRGYRVAATGEIELDGSVAPVGALEQKTLGARRAGVDVLLVPAGDNARVARRYADGLRVIAVENFQQALSKLATLPRRRS